MRRASYSRVILLITLIIAAYCRRLKASIFSIAETDVLAIQATIYNRILKIRLSVCVPGNSFYSREQYVAICHLSSVANNVRQTVTVTVTSRWHVIRYVTALRDCSPTHKSDCVQLHSSTATTTSDGRRQNNEWNEKKRSEETQTLRAGCSKAEPKIPPPRRRPPSRGLGTAKI